MTALIIISAVLLLLSVALLLPLGLSFKLDGEFYAKITLAGIKLYEIKPESDLKADGNKDAESDSEAKKKTMGIFERLKQKYGFSGAVNEIFLFIKALVTRLKKQLKKIKIKRLCLDIRVASADAAQTAIEYGAVCSAVYPVLSLIGTLTDVKMKKINIYADFNSEKSDFGFSAVIRTKAVFLIIMAFTAFSEYNKFKMRNEL